MVSEENDDIFEPTRKIINEIIKQSRYKPIVPFIGSGISVAAGYPSIGSVIHYLAKVDFAIQFKIYKNRLPKLDGNDDDLSNRYSQHPSDFIRDFGWPNIGRLDAELWDWIEKTESPDKLKDILSEVKQRDSLLAIVQYVLRQQQAERDFGTAKGIEEEWHRWKSWRKFHSSYEKIKPNLLYGDWEYLLDKLCEGDFALADQLFSKFEQGLYPTQAHRLLVFLQAKLGIPLVMTTNFDSLLERAFNEEGINPKIFDIHRDADLPDYDLVNHQLSILKLHGSAYGLRLGERLRLKLETDARQNALKYLPKNALILVIGFSGSERRMMQMLNAFMEVDSGNSDDSNLIWIQGPGKPGPLFGELTKKHGDNIKACRIKHADTFLQELYFQIANSHQSAIKPYSSLPGHNYLTELDIKFINNKANSYKRLKSIQIFHDNQAEEINNERTISKSWATLTGTAFVQSLASEGYRIIWIDLENHRTLESVLAEIFTKIQLVDSQAPSFNISLKISKTEDKDKNKALEHNAINKAAHRICDVLKRGRYVLALDSLDSFGRHPLGHHGIPNYKHNYENAKDEGLDFHFFKQTKRLSLLIQAVIKLQKPFHDSYIVVTIEKPSIRHPIKNKDEDKTYKYTKIAIDDILKKARQYNKKVSIYNNPDANYCYYNTFNESFKNIPFGSLTENFGDNWKIKEVNQDQHQSRAISRAKDVDALLKLLKSQKEDVKKILHEHQSIEGILSAFVCWLSIFRRPRTLPILRGMVDLWSIEGKEKDEHTEKLYHHNFRCLLALILPETKNDDNYDNFLNDYGFNHLSNKTPIGIAGQRLEGGSIWLFREAHEACYEALTENVHLQKWDDSWSSDKPIDLSTEAAILDGLVVINWHLQAAVNYHVNIYLPTKDVQAFYEYFYHRISALRVITLLIEIICRVKDKEWLKIEEDIQEGGLNWLKPCNQVSIFYIFGKEIGAFSELSDSSKEPNKKEHLLNRLIKLRCSLLKKTSMSLERNQDMLIAYSVPEIIQSWSTHIIIRDLPEITFEYPFHTNFYNLQEEHQTNNKAFIERAKDLKILFKKIAFKSQYAKLDFEEDKNNLQVKDFNEMFVMKEALIRQLTQRNIEKAILEINNLVSDIEVRKDKEKSKNETYKLEKLQRDLYAYGAKSILAKWSVWGYFNELIFPNLKQVIKNEDNKILETLSEATEFSEKYELSLRKTCESKDEELLHRSEYFAIKARILYLQKNFQKAHGYLDLAASNSQPKEIGHKINAGMVHILRAEMLAISADSHYGAENDETKRKKEVGASLKKIARAEQELGLAKNLFGAMSHQKLWQVYMELGFAQLQLERMLFELEALYLDWRLPNQIEYLKWNGKIEQTIIDALGYLRSVFDLLPFNSLYWSDVVCKSDNVLSDDLPALIKIEIMSYALWNSLFITGIIYSSLLDMSEGGKEAPVINDVFDKTKISKDFFNGRWQAWNKSMRFHKMHTSKCSLEYNCELSEYSSLRKAVIDTIKYQNTNDRIGEIWDERRE